MTASKTSNWSRVKFGDVVRNVNATTKDPASIGLERVVGLDHMDPESLPLKRWDELSDLNEGTSFTRIFRSGQILFGKRRAYQKKVSVPDFDGICSGDILVFEPSSDLLLPDFLPYIVQSDGFFEHALGTSAGSLSPRTKWQELAKYEFVLPPVGEQLRIIELLATVDELIDDLLEVQKLEANLLESLCNECWVHPRGRDAIASILKNSHFFDGDWIESKDQSDSGIRLLQLADIGVGIFVDKSNRFVSEPTFNRLKCNELFEGDILISRMADPIGRSCILPNLNVRTITVVDVCVLRLSESEKVNAPYWLAVTNSSEWIRQCLENSGGTTRTRVSRSKLERIGVPNLSADERSQYSLLFEQIFLKISQSNQNLRSVQILRQRLLSEFIGSDRGAYV